MIVRREDCHIDDGELDREIVTSASCTPVSCASIPRPKIVTWPIIRHRKVKQLIIIHIQISLPLSRSLSNTQPCSGSSPDHYGIEIEKPFEKSTNLSGMHILVLHDLSLLVLF